MNEPASLRLADGRTFRGVLSGASVPVAGEVVFNTAMSGYVESLTDPSYAGQIVVLTYPLIGNYGVPRRMSRDSDREGWQSGRIQAAGLVVQHLSEHWSHFLGDQSLQEWCARGAVPILSGVDTRSITQVLREHGTMHGHLLPGGAGAEALEQDAAAVDMRVEVFHRVTIAEPRLHPGGDVLIALVDIGTKTGIIECLRQRGASVLQVPWHADLEALTGRADGIVLSNGPGDPADLGFLEEQVRSLLGRFPGPVFGICLGHQVLARAAGFGTFKLKYGHRGVNQPVRDLGTRRCFVTSQNHGYAVNADSIPPGWEPWFENLNDGTNEGVRSTERPFFGVQFHPEGRPGPGDTEFLFDEFLRLAGQLGVGRGA